MPESCAIDSALSRKVQTAILQRLASAGQAHLGHAIGKSETWVSRWKDHDLKTCADLLSALGLKVVPAVNVCYPKEYVERLQYFAAIGIKQEPPSLEWDTDV